MGDGTDLSLLNDIVVPSPVSWWPPAPGWWILAVALLASIAIQLAAAVRRWRHDAYRRAALSELATFDARNDLAAYVAISAILKRTALVAYPRERVAHLTGRAWLAFLERTSKAQASIRDADIIPAACKEPRDNMAMLAFARRWVKHHRAEH